MVLAKMKATKMPHDPTTDSSRKCMDVTNFEQRTIGYDCLYMTWFHHHTDAIFVNDEKFLGKLVFIFFCVQYKFSSFRWKQQNFTHDPCKVDFDFFLHNELIFLSLLFSIQASDKEEARTDCIRSEGDLSSLKLKAGLMAEAGEHNMFHPSEHYYTWTVAERTDNLKQLLQRCTGWQDVQCSAD